jgi:hypothetical protein
VLLAGHLHVKRQKTMSVAIVLERPERITLEEWRGVVARDGLLRIRTEPYFAMNPRTRATIQLPLREADGEIQEDGEWVPFLRWQRGKLTTEYRDEFDDPTNRVRLKLVEVAEVLGAVLKTDAGDERLAW